MKRLHLVGKSSRRVVKNSLLVTKKASVPTTNQLPTSTCGQIHDQPYRNYHTQCKLLSAATHQQQSEPTTSLNPLYASLKVGDKVDGWTLEYIQELKDFDLVAYRLKHESTGAEYLHLDAPFDMNNSFAITFETPPANDTGIPHILEHTTLCGSEKYPVRDLFFNMMKRSLNTYMNAYTASDHTTYPFSTQNEKDFYNLMSVYLDSTLNPRILETDFKQEGHRLEFTEPLDPSSELQIKGVVYNEMKGAMSDSNQFFAINLQKSVLPGTIYAFNSGGEPEAIPNLTYEQLKNFHKENYHPSRARIYTYGNLSFVNHIKFMNEHGFNNFTGLPARSLSSRVEKFSEPKRVEVYGPPDSMVIDDTKQTKVSIAYLMNDKDDDFETFVLSFMSALLLDEPRGVFYKNIIASGLATDFAPGGGFDSSVGDPIFAIGAQGIGKDQVEQVEQAIEDTFKEVIENGIDQGLIDTVLHSIELSLKKKSPNFGVNMCFPVFSHWIHNNDPISTFKINTQLERLRRELENPNFFKDKIRKYFLDNKHKVTFVMHPDPNYFEKQQESEHAKIKSIVSGLSDADRVKIVQDYTKMESAKEDQSKNVEMLPTLAVDDIPRKILDPQNVKIEGMGPEFHMNIVKGTNGLVNVTSVVPISLAQVPEHLLKYVPLFGNVSLELFYDTDLKCSYL